ncbi:protein kinase domain-containing protein [Pengzhenrongella phosphoraccumulans]|uniref:protein kinase domain-containing protein n=1 Tax=Pengzhenrongella phosphoraccumulans TaxID=3114394 RepID=UPI00388F41F1
MRVEGLATSGGQAAVVPVRQVDDDEQAYGHKRALRVEFANGHDPRANNRRDAMLLAAYLSREKRDRYPALLRVGATFQLRVPSVSIPGGALWQGPGETTPLWCDIMEWATPLAAAVAAAAPAGAYTPQRAVAKMLPVLVTMAHMWADLQIVHRDIDEQNVLLTESGKLRIGDWGIATAVAHVEDGTLTAFAGKDGLLPPELVRSRSGPVGHFTDAWLLGRLLLRLITGEKSPYIDQVQFRFSPRIARDLPKPVAAVITGLCHPDHTQRMSAATAARQLDAWLRPPKVVDSVTRKATNLPRPTNRRDDMINRITATTATILVFGALTGALLVVSGTVAITPTPSTPAAIAAPLTRFADWNEMERRQSLLTRAANLNFSDWWRVSSDKAAGAGVMTAPATRWVGNELVLSLRITEITNASKQDQTFSWDCARPLDLDEAGDSTGYEAGPFLVVEARRVGSESRAAVAPSDWWFTPVFPRGKVISALSAACGLRDAALTPLATLWPAVTVPAKSTVTLPDSSNVLEFVLPHAGLPVGSLAAYPAAIDGVFFVSDDRTSAVIIRTPISD